MKRRYSFLLLAVPVAVVAWLMLKIFNRDLDYDVVLLKNEGEPVYDVLVRFDEFRFRFGNLKSMPGELAQSKFLMYYGQWPETLEVQWKEGGRESQPIQLLLSVPPPISVRREEQLELVIEFEEEGPVAYPRVKESFEKKGLSYRYND